MVKLPLPFVGPSYTLRSLNADCQRSLNLYPEVIESGTGKSVSALIGTPGLVRFATAGNGPVRGCWNAQGRGFVVSGSGLYELASDGAATLRGTLATSTSRVSMADNGVQLVIVTGAEGYILTLATNAFAQITDPDFGNADRVVFQDGYFIFNMPGTQQFQVTALYDGFSIDALDFAAAEGAPDDTVSILSDHRELWLFGSRSTEVYYNSGAADFPFERVQGAFIEHGIAARDSAAKLDNSAFWLGQDENGNGIVYRANGYQPQRISTHAVEQAIQRYADITTASAYTYQQDGHSFYVLNFDEGTWVFDVATGLWHERGYLNNGTIERHRGDCHMHVFGKHLLGDYATGAVYELSLTAYDDDGNPIVRERTATHIARNMERIFYASFQLDMETGVGLDGIGQGVNPQGFLQWSDDGGHSWSNELWRDVGRIGERKTRVIWRRLGASYDRVFRFRMSDPVRVVLLAAIVEAQ